MRLVCPNCDAEYEVDAAAIPEGGREVQCSACGHAWYQLPPDVLADTEEEAALYDPLPEPAAPAAEPMPEPAAKAVMPDTPPAAEVAPEEDELPPPPPPASAVPRGLDENLMAVLKEEAEREAAARKAEADRRAGLETQTELPLTAPAASADGPATAALRKIAKLRGEPEPKVADAARPRRELLPEIEEINSSLRAASEKRQGDQGAVADTLEAEMPAAAPARSGFRRGFLTVMTLVILGAALYVAAPMLSAKVPALAGVMAAYVQGVDAARIGLDDLAKTVIAKLTGLTGGQG